MIGQRVSLGGSKRRLRALGLVPLLLAFAGCATAPVPGVERPVEPVAEQAVQPATPPRQAGTLRLVAVGDVMMGTNFPDPGYLNPDLMPGADLASIIGPDLLSLLRGADITFGNMEGSLFDGPDTAEHKPCNDPRSCYVFRSPEFHAGLLRDMGFDVMSIANNHSGDFRAAGRAATTAALARNGIAYGGIDEPGADVASLRVANGLRVGFVAFAPNWGTLSINDPARAAAIVRALARTNDIVLVSFHGGAEGQEMTRVPREMEIFHGERRGDVYAFAHAVIDAGADIVLGQGPHVPRAVEVYGGRFIAYSLGNFWTYGRFNLKGFAGVAPVVDIEVAPDGRLLAARIHSIRQEGKGIPMLDPSGAALDAVRAFTARDFPESVLRFGADGQITGIAGAAVSGL